MTLNDTIDATNSTGVAEPPGNAADSASDAGSPTVSTLRTKPRRHMPFVHRHPWVHAHALADPGEGLVRGSVVRLDSAEERFLGWGLINPDSRLRVRLLSFDEDRPIDESLWRGRIDAAIDRRRLAGPGEPEGGERLCFSESDGLSGLIIDRYADCFYVQVTSAVWAGRLDSVVDQLRQSAARVGLNVRRLIVRIDEATAKLEGLDEAEIEKIESHGDGHTEGGLVWYRSGGRWMPIDLDHGQKTGGYLDQQQNHQLAGRYLTGRRVLDVCCYTGGFSLAAVAAGAESVIAVDSSATALELAGQAAGRNGADLELVQADCFDELKRRGMAGEKFGGVILDPPRFAAGRHQVDAAMRAYGRLNSMAVRLIEPGGILVTCSCSGRVSRADFLNMLADVSKRSGREIVILHCTGAPPDHPIAATCPESNYLKCVVAQVV